MEHDVRQARGGSGATVGAHGAAGKSTLTSRLRTSGGANHDDLHGAEVHDLAAEGTASIGGMLPYLDTIQSSFGHHEVGEVRAHVGGPAAIAAGAMGARAFAVGDDVAFAAPPDLHLAAHEAAHVVQQRGGVRLAGGVGQAGDPYEVHADAVADRVVRGESAEALLDTMAHRGAPGGRAVQRDAPTDRRTAQQVAEARAALARLGADDPDRVDELHNRGAYAEAIALARDSNQAPDQPQPNSRSRRGPRATPRPGPAPVEAATLHPDDAAAVAHMRRPTRIFDAPEATPDEGPHSRVRGTGSGVDSDAATANVGIAIHRGPLVPNDEWEPGDLTDPEHHEDIGITVGADGNIRGSVPLPGGALTGTYNPQAGTGNVGLRAGREDGTRLAGAIEIDENGLAGGSLEAQLGDDDELHGSAALTVDDHGHVTRAELGIQGPKVGPRKVRFGGQLVYQGTFGAPTLNHVTNQYDVTITLAITVDLSVGGRTRALELSGNIGGDFQERLVRHFGDEAAAQRWVDGDQPELDGAVLAMLRGHLDPAAARALTSDEELEVSSGGHGGGEIDAGVAQLAVRLHNSSTLTYRRIDEHTFRVGYRTEHGIEVTPGMQTPILGATIGFEHASREGRVVEFDLRTPAGRSALDQALNLGLLPNGERGGGWRVVEHSDGATDGSTTTIDALGSHGTIRSEVAVDRTTDEAGNVDVRAHGTNELVGEDNHFDVANRFDGAGTTRTEIDLTDGGAALDHTVEIEDAMSSQQALAAATGTQWHMGHGERTQSGTWHADVRLSDGQMRTVWSRLRRGDGRRFAHLLATHAYLVDTLVAAAHAAPSAEEARPAVADFISDAGAQGSQFLRALAGGETDYDVTLEGSTVFQGAEGRGQFEAQLVGLERRFADNPADPTLEADVRTRLREQQDRVSAMADGDTYALPPEVRRHELDANQPLLERARHLLRQVEAGTRRQATAAAHRRTADETVGEANGSLESSVENHEAGQALEAQAHGELAALHGDERRMLTARSRAVRLKAAIQEEGRIHHTPSPGNGIPPIELLTGVTGTSDGDYGAAHRAVHEADRLLNEARAFYADYESLRPRVPDSGLLDAAGHDVVAQVRRTCWALTTAYEHAFAQLEIARVHYVTIRHDHPSTGIWGQSHAVRPVT